MHLPFEVADYVDFYSSRHHAENVGRMFRPDAEPLPPNWRHLPIGYHGRAGTVAVSGTPVRAPVRPAPAPGDDVPAFGPSRRLDFEAEVGFVVGAPSELGDAGAGRAPSPSTCSASAWSTTGRPATCRRGSTCRSGPFLGKSFLTSVSPWVVPLAALEAARVPPPPRDPSPLPYLRDDEHPWGLDLSPRGAAQRRGGQPSAVRRPVLDGRPAARAPDGQRGLAAHRRPVRLGHRQRAASATSAGRCSSCPGTGRSR